MKAIAYFLLTACSSVDQEAQLFVQESTKQINEEASTFLRGFYEEKEGQKSPKCKNCLSYPLTLQDGNPSLLVFISFSVSLESWKEWSKEMEDRGGWFVLRGLPDNSFETLVKKIEELRSAGVATSIMIDPEAYQKYRIKTVPSLVLLRGNDYDKIAGNIRIQEIERLFNANLGLSYRE